MVLNLDKTKVPSVCRKRESILNNYVLGSTKILRASVVRDLGVYFNDHLSFSYHISEIVASSVRLLGLISRLTNQFSF